MEQFFGAGRSKCECRDSRGWVSHLASSRRTGERAGAGTPISFLRHPLLLPRPDLRSPPRPLFTAPPSSSSASLDNAIEFVCLPAGGRSNLAARCPSSGHSACCGGACPPQGGPGHLRPPPQARSGITGGRSDLVARCPSSRRLACLGSPRPARNDGGHFTTGGCSDLAARSRCSRLSACCGCPCPGHPTPPTQASYDGCHPGTTGCRCLRFRLAATTYSVELGPCSVGFGNRSFVAPLLWADG
ncbi:uncharacterized protein [Triticum aestivum]|uniref:uncharacterized protein n=1 Tax=Triticum aestivum TaxID=4565 RepID=UPI001D0082AE|nr:uncharacterized protein LOC123056697 [Triticum aestivum]